jgi:hypothetical protein
MSKKAREEGPWRIDYSSSAKKQKRKLPGTVIAQLASLTWDLEHYGPIQPEWSHYSSLKKGKNVPLNAYHCHIKSGRPTFVVCWQVVDKATKIIEIFYVGTHENAPY